MQKPITWSATKEFLWSIYTDWLALMSGAFSVPFTFISTYASSIYTKIIFSSLAVLALLFSAFRIWHNQKIFLEGSIEKLTVENADLEERLRPKLIIQFGENIDGCVIYAKSKIDPTLKAFRLKVVSDSALRLTGCTGYLRSVTSKWSNFTHQPIKLTFAPAEDTLERVNKNIDHGCHVFLDLFIIYTSNDIRICSEDFQYPNEFDQENFFKGYDEYVFDVVIGSNESVTVEKRLKLTWSGHWQTARLEII